MIRKRPVSASSPTRAIPTPMSSVKSNASPATPAAAVGRPSPCRRAATAVRPTPIISASATIIQIQKSDVETAANPSEPMRVPTQNASTDAKSVMSSDDATAGSATRAIVLPNESETRWAAVRPSATPTVARPSRASTGTLAGSTTLVDPATRPSRQRDSVSRDLGGLADTFGDSRQRPGRRRCWLGDDDRLALISRLEDAGIQRNLSEQRQLECGCQSLAAARAEQRRRLAAMRTLEPAHVLDDA